MSIYPVGVTQTGQPGPEIILTLSGRREWIPERLKATVWVPHTSMMRISRSNDSASSLISRTSGRASSRLRRLSLRVS